MKSSSPAGEFSFPTPLRISGFLPLIFFIAHFHFYWSTGGIENMLWMCNVGNLLLALGLFARSSWIIRLAVIWLIPGLPLWGYYVAITGGFLITSFFTHIGALAVGLPAFHWVRADRWTWVHGLWWYLVIQQLCRLLTPPFWNVNIAHAIYTGWESVFSSYWQFWVVTTLVVAVGLWFEGLILLRLFPPLQASTAQRAGV